MDAPKVDYGIDAPKVMRNLFLAGFVFIALGFVGSWFQWSWAVGAFFVAGATYWLWSSRVGKLQQREYLLDLVQIKGSEHVLDVGCGRGLLLIGAAKRLTGGGKAIGIDIWQKEDLSNNNETATRINITAEGVTDRAEVHSCDMRELDFPNESFDAVVSSLAIHNVEKAGQRKALNEIVRVLKPGGRLAIQDIHNTASYAEILKSFGMEVVKRSAVQLRICPPARIVTGRKQAR
jgi:arsenite methyltransferase